MKKNILLLAILGIIIQTTQSATEKLPESVENFSVDTEQLLVRFNRPPSTNKFTDFLALHAKIKSTQKPDSCTFTIMYLGQTIGTVKCTKNQKEEEITITWKS